MKGKSATAIFKWTKDCPFISSEDGGNSQQATAAYKQIMIMTMIIEEYLPSRLGISPCREQFRMETFAKGITGNREKVSPSNNRPFRIQTSQYNATKLNLAWVMLCRHSA